MLFKSTAVHIPLLGQCCFFNVSASCLWVFRVFFWGGGVLLKLNLTDHTLLSLPPPPILQPCLPLYSLSYRFLLQRALLNFSEVISLRFLHKRIGEWEGREGNVQVENCLGLPQPGSQSVLLYVKPVLTSGLE